MRKFLILSVLTCTLIALAGCSTKGEASTLTEKTSIGLLVTKNGLGDDSFSDSAIRGLQKARDELGILFDYREPVQGEFTKSIQELIDQDHDLIVGLGYNSQQAIDEMAKKYPDQQFILIDAVSEHENVTSITFKEDEGSYLIGLIAGMRTDSNTVGFIGGEKIKVVENFEKGFREGVREANPDAEVLAEYIGTFQDDEKGAKTAKKQIENGADFIFPAAGFAGVGALKEAQRQGKYAFGVDSDQFFLAEEAVVTSMLKRVDTALFNMAQKLKEEESFSGEHIQLGLKQDGVGLAPIRIIDLTSEESNKLEQAKGKED
ncbi:BMP family ABC transporter substrate-binding protein [Pontibacillus yanchengensis]|uniref:BMP family ABC transporter substrate-binding protein n=2 Tax=Pontibacillus yanchengensis TaxID=462910 RepID=A0ACC7VKC0_9BACI|nr:BMP family ABC transporter substrate-binding protein [Pontibacillus yanchengensis]MYL35047.1 BMP family ABC transporter substrate-binding protein [Pontibacillus yanchengensis]MYL55242.1 BMP family ABC transporter substrate-binding protein [Pontibacillus yanchengensis]